MYAQMLSHVQLFCDLMDSSPLGSSVHGILQARILEWVVFPFSRGSSLPKDQTHIFCTGKQILYHHAIWETSYVYAHTHTHTHVYIFVFIANLLKIFLNN